MSGRSGSAEKFIDAIIRYDRMVLSFKREGTSYIMAENEDKHKELLNRIIEIELNMFMRVRTTEPAACQERPETFRVMREMNHFFYSDETLRSYLEDLESALASGRNLLTEKYARMDDLIPPLKDNPLIAEIVGIEQAWMDELRDRYPLTFQNPAERFGTYLSSELETYSDRTLELIFKDLTGAKQEGRNLAEERYSYLFKKIGYGSIDEVEKKKGG